MDIKEKAEVSNTTFVSLLTVTRYLAQLIRAEGCYKERVRERLLSKTLKSTKPKTHSRVLMELAEAILFENS